MTLPSLPSFFSQPSTAVLTASEHHGYFDHSNGSYINGLESLVQTMIKAATSDDASYTLESVYNNAPQ